MNQYHVKFPGLREEITQEGTSYQNAAELAATDLHNRYTNQGLETSGEYRVHVHKPGDPVWREYSVSSAGGAQMRPSPWHRVVRVPIHTYTCEVGNRRVEVEAAHPEDAAERAARRGHLNADATEKTNRYTVRVRVNDQREVWKTFEVRVEVYFRYTCTCGGA